MGKTVTYFILALVIILGLTYMATQAEFFAGKSPATIHANDISADKEDDIPIEDVEDVAHDQAVVPFREFLSRGRINHVWVRDVQHVVHVPHVLQVRLVVLFKLCLAASNFDCAQARHGNRHN